VPVAQRFLHFARVFAGFDCWRGVPTGQCAVFAVAYTVSGYQDHGNELHSQFSRTTCFAVAVTGVGHQSPHLCTSAVGAVPKTGRECRKHATVDSSCAACSRAQANELQLFNPVPHSDFNTEGTCMLQLMVRADAPSAKCHGLGAVLFSTTCTAQCTVSLSLGVSGALQHDDVVQHSNGSD
jgi:hypothetical protein